MREKRKVGNQKRADKTARLLKTIQRSTPHIVTPIATDMVLPNHNAGRTPVREGDLANKAYVDAHSGGSGGGDVYKDGTPVAEQIAVWTDDETIQGTTALTFDGSDLQVTGGTIQSVGTGGTIYVFTLDADNPSGPRMMLGTDTNLNAYFEVGAWNNINNFDSKNRDLNLYTSLSNIYIDAGVSGVGINNTAPSEALDVTGNIAVSGTVDGIDIATDVAANTAKTGITSAQASAITANTSARHTQNTDTALGSGCTASDHGTASTDQVINVCYGTSATPPTASTTTEGTLYIQYTA